ncbi:GNAT family N-acetyltransferase [Flavivirga eckloniae]|uniref:GNAT family N-acetyltransferase n=1 Tax=Flavivirga eckloniae TaxID=1803846 RepID=A0A2K9PSC5_9FLAO|nr:GNAT family N-acetyltransferase [Flavivirga eckloniae]AUP79467.1 GNAT family N-acetyltransferase [Flavivirga eckloniae]
MKIVIAKKEDLEQILELQKACYLEEAELYNDFEIPPLTQTLDSIKSDYEKERFLKIEYEGKIVGSVRGYLEDGTCKIGRLIVDKNLRNNGLGKRLIKEIESQFDSAQRFELFTGYKSKRNLSLYNKLGYSEFQKRRINEKLEFIFLEKENNKKSD